MRSKRKNGMIKMVALYSLTVVVAATSIYLLNDKKEEYKGQAESYSSEIEANQRTVYVALKDVKKGDALTLEELDENGNVTKEANVELRTIYSGLDMETFMAEEDIGKRSLIDIAEGDPVLKSVVLEREITNSLREYEISKVQLMKTQEEGDFIDIRITYPDGETFVVLPKKEIIKLPDGVDYFTTYLNEDDILNYVSAMIDSFLIPGTSIYTTAYIEPNIQVGAVKTYVPRVETLSMLLKDSTFGIQNNANIEKGLTIDEYNMLLQARNSLVSYLATLPVEQTDALSSAFGSNSAGVSVISSSDSILDLSGLGIENSENITDEVLLDENGNPIGETEDSETEQTEQSVNVTVE